MSTGRGFEWQTEASILGSPLICIAFGHGPNGQPKIASGWLAIGQFAYGGVVIAQFGAGIVTLSQFAVGLFAFGQLAVGVVLGSGQAAAGLLAIGQVVCGLYGMCQLGWAKYMWSPGRIDMEAVSMFYTAKDKFPEIIWRGARWAGNWLQSLF